jgi:hypothetical protein
VRAGDCVLATSASGSPSASSFNATQVTISPPVNGQCGGTGRAGGQAPGSAPTGAPRSVPSGAPRFPSRTGSFPSGSAGGFPRTGAFATGKVTSVSGNAIVVAARQFGTGASTTSRTVTVGTLTKITTQQSTSAAALKVGLCVNAVGKPDSAGTVTATSVHITSPVNGQCTLGLGVRNG